MLVEANLSHIPSSIKIVYGSELFEIPGQVDGSTAVRAHPLNRVDGGAMVVRTERNQRLRVQRFQIFGKRIMLTVIIYVIAIISGLKIN